MFAPQMLAPVPREELSPVDSRWGARDPDFIGVGMPKAATTWLYASVLKSAGVGPNRTGHKETCLLCHSWHGGFGADLLKLYREYFRCDPALKVGEWSTLYWMYPGVLSAIIDAFPDTKLIVSLRDPVEQLHSHLSHLKRHRMAGYAFDEPEKSAMFKLYSIYPETYQMACQVKARLSLLASPAVRQRSFIIQYEKFKQAPIATLRALCEFLEVDPPSDSQSVSAPVNVGPSGYRRDSAVSEHIIREVVAANRGIQELFPEIDEGLWSS